MMYDDLTTEQLHEAIFASQTLCDSFKRMGDDKMAAACADYLAQYKAVLTQREEAA